MTGAGVKIKLKIEENRSACPRVRPGKICRIMETEMIFVESYCSGLRTVDAAVWNVLLQIQAKKEYFGRLLSKSAFMWSKCPHRRKAGIRGGRIADYLCILFAAARNFSICCLIAFLSNFPTLVLGISSVMAT